jgi:nucleoside-diphosphate-sugar epimerase
MKPLPKLINTVAELDEILSRPTDSLVESMKRMSGDIMILGAGGKVGPTLALMAKRAIAEAGVSKKVYAVDLLPLPALKAQGIETIACDMMDLAAVERLPKVENIVYMVGRKFGSTGSESLTWAINVMVPYHVARTFTGSRIAAFSTGCVYPVVHINSGGSVETDPANPVGEYAQSCLGRERMFDFFSEKKGERVVHVRLNYAVELRYGVVVDVATKVFAGEAVDVTTGFANGIWQGDACNQVIQSLELATSPASILNVTGPETFSIREVAHTFGKLFGKEAIVTYGYLNNARKANALFGNPTVPLGRMIEWIAGWIRAGGENIGKPTHFETQNGKY